jgi:hypothetical protein
MLRKVAMSAAALTFAFGAFGVGIASSGAAEPTRCTFSHDPDLSPGLSSEPTSGSFTDPGGGTIECHGPVNGHEPTGPGTYTDSGRYGSSDPDTCLGGEAEGDPQFVVPTDAGPQTVTDHIKIVYKEPSTKGGVLHATFEGEHSSGTIELTPTKGDCLSAPVTKVNGTGEIILK